MSSMPRDGAGLVSDAVVGGRGLNVRRKGYFGKVLSLRHEHAPLDSHWNSVILNWC